MNTRVLALGYLCSELLSAVSLAAAPSPYAAWPNGPSTNADFFPIAVWLQNPSRAKEYAAAGINTYVALWKGPTEEQLAALKAAGMKLICDQNDVALRHLDDPTIIGWMHGDEPDNAQEKPGGGYGPPVEPAHIISDYQRIKQADPSRPIMLNLGQGVAWDNWHGRGVRSRHPEDYVEYVKGSDIVSFDIYPAVHDHPEVAGKLWFVAQGVERLRGWAGTRPVWNCIECTRIGNPTTKATPAQVRAEVWMSLVHGSRGLIYFVHEWKPRFVEAGLLADKDMLAAVTTLNHQVQRLAPVLNEPPDPALADVTGLAPEARVAVSCHVHAGALYVFAVALRDKPTSAIIRLKSTMVHGTRVEVLDEGRSLDVKDGGWTDTFDGWGVHLYRLPLSATGKR